MSIRCPYHLGDIRIQRREGSYLCPECRVTLPRDYVEREIPKINVGLVGASGHGKSVFLASLFYLLQHMVDYWPGYYYLTCDDHTNRVLHVDLPRFAAGQLPKATPVHFPRPALVHYHHLPDFGSCFVGFYDAAGEIFADLRQLTQLGRFVAYADVVLFLVSLPESMADWHGAARLLNTYLQAVRDHFGVEPRARQHLVLLFTKADLCLADLPAELREALLERGFCRHYQAPRSKLAEMERLSGWVQSWLGRHGGRLIINTLAGQFRSVAYTLVSATGDPPEGDRLPGGMTPHNPKRVLDPFLWVLARATASRRPRRRTLWRRLIERFWRSR